MLYPFTLISSAGVAGGVRIPVKHPAAVKAPQLLHVGEPEMGAFGLPIVHIRSRLPTSWQRDCRYGLLEVECVGLTIIFHGYGGVDVP